MSFMFDLCNKLVLSFVIVVLVFFVVSSSFPGSTTDEQNKTKIVSESTQCDTRDIIADHYVCYTENGYIPQSISIARGDVVAFVSKRQSLRMWTASDDHPLHQGYNGTDIHSHCETGSSKESVFDQCGLGRVFVFKFDKKGAWAYHNHSWSAHQGIINVE